MKKYILIGLCWLIPLFLGVGTFLAWLITRLDILMVIGVYILYLGFLCVFIGFIIWIKQFITYKKRRIKQEIIITSSLALLMLLNIPIGICILLESYSLHTEYIVEVQNTSPYEVQDIVIEGGGVYESVDLIPIGEKKVSKFWIKHDGILRIKYKQNDKVINRNISEYVTNGMGGTTKVIIE